MIYWAVVGLTLVTAVYIALLDLRYIRLQYTLGEKELFDETLGSEEFRNALLDARKRESTAARREGSETPPRPLDE